MRARTVHFPPQLVADLVNRTPLDQWPDTVIERALQAFAVLPRTVRELLVSDYWWGAIRQGSWRALAITEVTWQLATACKTTAWGVAQIIVAACEWFVRSQW